MKKNNKGFTLVELLAVIVILAVIVVIAGSNLTGTKKKANIDEAIQMEKMIEDLGPVIYADEKLKDDSEFITNYKSRNTFYIESSNLKAAGYLKGDIKNPNGGLDCEAYLLVDPTNGFKGYINCDKLYATGQPDEDYSPDDFDAVKYALSPININ